MEQIPSLVLGTHGVGQQVHLPTMKEQTSIRGVCSIGAISTQRETDPGTEKRKCVGKFGKSQHFVEELRSLSWKYDFDSNYSNSFFLWRCILIIKWTDIPIESAKTLQMEIKHDTNTDELSNSKALCQMCPDLMSSSSKRLCQQQGESLVRCQGG